MILIMYQRIRIMTYYHYLIYTERKEMIVTTKLIHGRPCLVIELNSNIEVNGIAVNPM
ncbi:hypothetical protein LEA_04420 [human gut metagenome]|uniref:Uncharacterized protein n=2 Tax=human gut metagenome TaxID=408170 RepID=K1TVA1_9ZZZZ